MRLLRGCGGLLLATGLMLPLGCQAEARKEPPIRTAGQPADAAAEDAETDAAGETAADGTKTTREKKLTGIRFDVPKAWQEQPQSEFYEAKYAIPSDEGTMYLTMTTMGGGIEANFDRWIGQFRRDPGNRPRRETLNVGSKKARWLDVQGTFRSQVGDSPGPHPDWRMLGVAIPMTPRPFLLKLIGPRAAIAAFHDEYRDFVRSGRLD